MRYFLTIKRLEKNEEYEQEMKDWQERNKYNNNYMGDGMRPMPDHEYNALQCILTEEEFVAIKKSAIEVIK